MKRCEVRPSRAWRPYLVGLALVAVQTGAAGAQEPTHVPRFLRLSDAIGIAMEGSTQLGIRQAQLDASRTARLNAIFSLGPDIQVSAFDSRQTRTDLDLLRSSGGVSDQIRTVNDNFIPVFIDTSFVAADVSEESGFRQVSVQSSVRFFDGLANYYRIAAAHNDVRANELDLQYAATTVQTSVIEAYYDLLRAKLLLTVAAEAEAVSREQLERTQALYELGSAARSDVLKSQVQLGQTRLELVQARNRERQARNGLIYAMNLKSATPFAIDTTVVDIPEEQIDFGAEVRYALDHRLDLMALREAERGQGKRVVEARGALFPTLDFRYSFAFSDQESQFRFGAAQTRTRSWTLSSSWGVFDRYLTYSNISQAKANRRIAEYNLKQAELDAIREIRDFVNQLQEARERFVVSSENVERSEEDLRLAQEKFRVGAGTILDTITAESDLTATKAAEVEASVDYLIARAKLSRATGRPFSEL
ncbi:MAG: TolC family protein [Candidatus Krumholzibacteriia bacterium]